MNQHVRTEPWMGLHSRARITILIVPTLGALFPWVGPIQDPVLTQNPSNYLQVLEHAEDLRLSKTSLRLYKSQNILAALQKPKQPCGFTKAKTSLRLYKSLAALQNASTKQKTRNPKPQTPRPNPQTSNRQPECPGSFSSSLLLASLELSDTKVYEP